MFTIKEHNPHRGGSVKYYNRYETRDEAENDLAYWLSQHGMAENNDSNSRLRLEYGLYAAPSQEQLDQVFREFTSVGYTASDPEDEDARSLQAGYDPKEDRQWYTWPDRIGGYSYDSVSWHVEEIADDPNN